MHTKLKGTGVALVTPLDVNGNVDYVAFEKLVEHVINGGVNYILVNGTTSESSTTTKDEKALLLLQKAHGVLDVVEIGSSKRD